MTDLIMEFLTVSGLIFFGFIVFLGVIGLIGKLIETLTYRRD